MRQVQVQAYPCRDTALEVEGDMQGRSGSFGREPAADFARQRRFASVDQQSAKFAQIIIRA